MRAADDHEAIVQVIRRRREMRECRSTLGCRYILVDGCPECLNLAPLHPMIEAVNRRLEGMRQRCSSS